MAAGLGFKTFNTGEVLTSADVNGYLMQGVLVFASEAARNAAITSPQEGQFAYTKDNNSLWYYTGSAWAASGATGDIEGVTAGTGISGGGTSGTVTITNSMATAIDAKGDLVVGTGADTFARLAVGTDGYTLVADSVETTGLKWVAPSAGALTKITSADFTTQSSVTIDSIFSATYKRYMMVIDLLGSTSLELRMQFRYSTSTESSANYYGSNFKYKRDNTDAGNGFVNTTFAKILYNLDATPAQLTMYFSGVGNTSERAAFWMNGFNSGDSQASILGGGRVYVDRTYTGIIFTVDTGTITGNYQIYGLAN